MHRIEKARLLVNLAKIIGYIIAACLMSGMIAFVIWLTVILFEVESDMNNGINKSTCNLIRN